MVNNASWMLCILTIKCWKQWKVLENHQKVIISSCVWEAHVDAWQVTQCKSRQESRIVHGRNNCSAVNVENSFWPQNEAKKWKYLQKQDFNQQMRCPAPGQNIRRGGGGSKKSPILPVYLQFNGTSQKTACKLKPWRFVWMKRS